MGIFKIIKGFVMEKYCKIAQNEEKNDCMINVNVNHTIKCEYDMQTKLEICNYKL